MRPVPGIVIRSAFSARGVALWRLAGRSAIKSAHVETPEADSKAIDRVEPADAAGDRRTEGARPPAGRGNAGDPGGPETADGGGISFHTDADHGDAVIAKPVCSDLAPVRILR
jgi:hypothetical protein